MSFQPNKNQQSQSQNSVGASQTLHYGRVLSVRLPNSTILACYDLCEVYRGGFSFKLSTTIIEALELLISEKQDLGIIPIYENQEECFQILQEKSQSGKNWDSPRQEKHQTIGYRPNFQRTPANEQQLQKLQQVCFSDSQSSDFAPESFDEEDFAGSGLDGEFATELEQAQKVSVEKLKPILGSLELGFTEEEELSESEKAQAFEKLINEEILDFQEAERQDLLSKIMVKQESPRIATSLISTKHFDKVSLVPENDPDLQKDKVYKSAQDSTVKTAIRMVYFAMPKSEWGGDSAKLLVEQTILNLKNQLNKQKEE